MRISDWSSDVCSSDLPNAITDQALANANLPMVTGEVVKKALGADAEKWVAPTAWTALRDAIKADPKILAQTVTLRLPAATATDQAAKGDGSPEAEEAVEWQRVVQGKSVTVRVGLGV